MEYCQWGVATVVEAEQPYKGGPVPLWRNIQPGIFAKLSVASTCFLVVCLLESVVIIQFRQKPEKENLRKGYPNDYICYANANVSFIVNILSMLINAGFYSFLAKLEYASDKQWSQIMTINGINIVVQTIGAILATSLLIREQVELFDRCFTIVKALYIRQYIYIIANFLVIIFQITSLTRMTVEYKFNTQKHYAFKRDPEIRVKM